MKNSAQLMNRHRVVALGLVGVGLASGLGLVAHLAAPDGLAAGMPADAIGEVTGTQVQAVPVPPAGEWVYGARLHFAGLKNSSGNPVTLTSRTPDVCRVEGANRDYLRLVAVGGCSFSVHQDGDEVYAAFDGNLDRGVAPRPLEVSVVDASRPSGAIDPEWQLEYHGLLAGDTVVNAPKVAHPPRDAAPGRYPLVPSGGGVPNYRLTYTAGVLTINPRVTMLGGPQGMPGLKVDGIVDSGHPYSAVAPYGTSGSRYTYDAVIHTKAQLFITTDQMPDTITTDEVITYTTIPALIAQTSYSAEVQSDMNDKWNDFYQTYNIFFQTYDYFDLERAQINLGALLRTVRLQPTRAFALEAHLALVDRTLL